MLEFLDLPESHRLVESRIEEALINQLQAFLLELGSGFEIGAKPWRYLLIPHEQVTEDKRAIDFLQFEARRA